MKQMPHILLGVFLGFFLAALLIPISQKFFATSAEQHVDLTGIYMTRNYNGRYDIDPNWPGPFWIVILKDFRYLVCQRASCSEGKYFYKKCRDGEGCVPSQDLTAGPGEKISLRFVNLIDFYRKPEAIAYEKFVWGGVYDHFRQKREEEGRYNYAFSVTDCDWGTLCDWNDRDIHIYDFFLVQSFSGKKIGIEAPTSGFITEYPSSQNPNDTK